MKLRGGLYLEIELGKAQHQLIFGKNQLYIGILLKKNKLTTSIGSKAQKNLGWKNKQRELGSRCSVIIKKKTKSQNLYENLIFVSFETEPTDRRTK